MAQTLSSTITAQIRGSFRDTPDVGTASYVFDQEFEKAMANGTGSNQANSIFTDTRTLSASATEDLDLSGSLTNAFGTSIVFTKVKAIMIQAAAENTNDVVVGNATSNAWSTALGATGTVTIKPGGCFFLAAPVGGYTVTAGTGDLLKVANSAGGTGVDYTIVITGTV